MQRKSFDNTKRRVTCSFRLEGFNEADIYAMAKALHVYVTDTERKPDGQGYYGYGVVQRVFYQDRFRRYDEEILEDEYRD